MARAGIIQPGLSRLRLLESLVLVVAILYFAKPVIVPLALAVLLAFVLTPIVMLVQRSGLKRVPAVLLVVCSAFLLLTVTGWGVGSQLRLLVRDLPSHKQEIKQKIAALRSSKETPLGRFIQMIEEVSSGTTDEASAEAVMERPVIIAEPGKASALERLLKFVGPVLEPLAMAGLVVILVVFMLAKREDLRNRVICLLGHGHLTGTTRVFVDAAERVSKFLLNQLIVNVAFGVVFGVGLMLFGIPYAFLWAFLTALLRFVPYIGSWLAVAFPVLLSFAITPGWTQPLLLLLFFICLDLVTANVIEPLLFGHSTGVAPIALLIAAAFWTWLWGPIGLVLSTPLTVCLVALGQDIPRFKFLALLLGDEPALAPHASYFQRLVARDPEEAREVARRYIKQFGEEKVYDELFLPALALARRDRKLGGLTAEEEEYVYRSTRAILEQLPEAIGDAAGTGKVPGEKTKESAPEETANRGEKEARALVLGCPAHHEAEELSLLMLRQLLRTTTCRLEPVSSKALPVEIEERVEAEKPVFLFVAVLPPGGLMQARFLCKRLARRFPRIRIVVGYWGGSCNFDKLLVRFRAAGASYITTSLLQARTQVQALLPTVNSAPVNQGLEPTLGSKSRTSRRALG